MEYSLVYTDDKKPMVLLKRLENESNVFALVLAKNSNHFLFSELYTNMYLSFMGFNDAATTIDRDTAISVLNDFGFNAKVLDEPNVKRKEYQEFALVRTTFNV